MVGLTFTMTAAAAPLVAVGNVADIPCREIWLQADGANASIVKVGGPDVSTTIYGMVIPAATAGVPVGPISLGATGGAGGIKPSGIWLLGANTEKVHALLVPL